MNCPNCHELVESGSAFCGNCGFSLSQSTVSKVLENESPDEGVVQSYFPVAATTGTSVKLPNYAIPNNAGQRNHLRASLSLVLGLVGIAGAMTMPVAGVVLGLAGVVLATLSMRSFKHLLSQLGLVASIISILVGSAAWVYAVSSSQDQVNKTNKAINTTNNSLAQATNSVTTPCFTLKFATKVNVENVTDSCFLNAFNAASINQSTDAYKILATNSSVTISNFYGVAKQSLEADVKQSLKGFTITKENTGIFAASPAFFVTADNGGGVSVIEAAVLHLTAHGENFFVLVHAVNGSSVDLLDLQLGWSWE